MFRNRRNVSPPPSDEDNFVYILEGSDDALNRKAQTLSLENDVVTVPTILVGDKHLTHQHFQDDLVGSLSRVLKGVDAKIASAISASEAQFRAQISDAETRHAAALKVEQQKTEELAAELATVRNRERLLAFKFACLATEIGGFDAMIRELGVDEAAVHKAWEEKLTAERAEAEKKKAKTKATMEASARERADNLRLDLEKEDRKKRVHAARRSHLDFTLWFLVHWNADMTKRFVGRHATVDQVLAHARSLGIDWARMEWDVKFSEESGYNEDARKKGIDVRRCLREVRDWAVQYLQETPLAAQTTAQMDWYAISRDQHDTLKTAERKGDRLPDSKLEGFYSWMWCAQQHVATAKWSLRP